MKNPSPPPTGENPEEKEVRRPDPVLWLVLSILVLAYLATFFLP